MKTYDAIVLGTGGVGSAALYHLARRGAHVLGIDRHRPPHTWGSSHGHTRVIRQAYFEHSDYVPLLAESYRLWRDLEADSGRALLHETGVIEIGPPDGQVLPGVLQAARDHRLEVESMTAADIEHRWPGLRVPAAMQGVFEPRGGYLLVESCIAAHLEAAAAAGARLSLDTELYHWQATGNEIRLQTSAGEMAAATLVVTAGAWAGKLLHGLNVDLHVRRKSLFWCETDTPRYRADEPFPVFLFELPHGVFYGFPQLDARGIKVGEHSGGQAVADPALVDRRIDPDDLRAVRAFLAHHLPGVSPRVADHTVCLYTMSPDGQFLVDRHPAWPHVVFAAGLSGHGFKFAPALGLALADLAHLGTTDQPVDFLSLKRVG